MSSHRHDDPLIQALAALPRVAPDPGHAQRVRARCRGAMATPPAAVSLPLEPVAVGTVCALYAWEIVRSVVIR